jgi:hypothetical protein
MTNYTTTKGFGDFEPPCAKEPTDEQVQRYIKDNAYAVSSNITEWRSGSLTYALIKLVEKDDASDLHQLLTDSAVELMEKGL